MKKPIVGIDDLKDYFDRISKVSRFHLFLFFMFQGFYYFYWKYVMQLEKFSNEFTARFMWVYLFSLFPLAYGEMLGHFEFSKVTPELKLPQIIGYAKDLFYSWGLAAIVWTSFLYLCVSQGYFEFEWKVLSWKFVLEGTFYYFFESILFYTYHRSLHHPLFYRKVHYVHHTRTKLTYIDGDHLHPIETAINSTAMLIPPLLFHFCFGQAISLCAWSTFLVVRQFITTDCHVGRRVAPNLLDFIPFYMKKRTNHLYHHKHNGNKNFGYQVFWEKLFGTYHDY